jgi:capsule polysaccharide export protein KpsE/RkpR
MNEPRIAWLEEKCESFRLQLFQKQKRIEELEREIDAARAALEAARLYIENVLASRSSIQKFEELPIIKQIDRTLAYINLKP